MGKSTAGQQRPSVTAQVSSRPQTRMAAKDLIDLDRSWGQSKVGKVKTVTLEHMALPEDAADAALKVGTWKVNVDYTQPKMHISTAKSVKLGGLTLVGADQFRPLTAQNVESPIGHWSYITHGTGYTGGDTSKIGSISRMIFTDETQSEVFMGTGDQRIYCTCTSYADLPVCPHQALIAIAFTSEVAPDQIGIELDGAQKMAFSQMFRSWTQWMDKRGTDTEGEQFAKVYSQFEHYAKIRADGGKPIEYEFNSASLRKEVEALWAEFAEEEEARTGGAVEDAGGEFRHPVIDSMFEEVASPRGKDWGPTASIPVYPKDIVITPNLEKALFAVSNAVRDHTHYVFGFLGPKGTGKDTAARAIATALRRPTLEIDCSNMTNFGRMLGGSTLKAIEEKIEVTVTDEAGHKSTKEVTRKPGGSAVDLVIGGIGQAAQDGWIIIIDEIIAAHEKMRTSLHRLLNDGFFTIDDPVAGTRRFDLHPDTLFFMTWNPGTQEQLPGEALTDRALNVVFAAEPPEALADKLAAYLNARFDTDEFVREDCLAIGELVGRKIPTMVAAKTLKHSPSYRQARVLADQLWFIVRSGKKISEKPELASLPLEYTANQDPAQPHKFVEGVQALRAEILSTLGDNSSLIKKFRQLAQVRAAEAGARGKTSR